MITLSSELIASAIVALISAIFWYWVRSIDKHHADDRQQLEYIKRSYVRRDDYHMDNKRVYDLLREIKAQLDKLDDKLDKKADKK